MSVRAVYLGLFLVLSLAAGAIYYAGTREATVVVARGDLRPGAQLTETALAVRRVSPAAIPPGTASSLDEVLGRYVAWPVLDGQYLPLRALARDRAALISADLQVPPGYHAISLAVSAADAVGGAVRPGDHVDVLAVARNQAPGASPAPAALLGSHVLVLGLRTDTGQPLDLATGATGRGLDFASARIGSILIAVSGDDESRYATASATSSFTVVLDL
ncbi:MAG TPA: Flp pilus assembly protein CpaB [Candidatus Dormibacteraeota bacterium]|nr:Flp pilus assembly protein CpaB [Candidatus Dormibacteraeota bacterium]